MLLNLIGHLRGQAEFCLVRSDATNSNGLSSETGHLGETPRVTRRWAPCG